MILISILCPHTSKSQDNSSGSGKLLTLENENLAIVLSGLRPEIISYRLKSTGGELYGDTGGSGPEIAFYRGAETVMEKRTEISYSPTASGNQVVYHAKIKYENQDAIDFDLTYTLNQNGLIIKFGNVAEHGNYLLLNVVLPGLVTVRSDEHHGALVIPADAGRLIDIEKASLKSYEYEIDWLNPILAGFVYNSNIIAVMDTKSIENHTIASVSERSGIRYGSLSMKMIYRLNTYDLAEFGTVIPATDPKYFLKVQDSCSVSLALGGDYDGDKNISWVDGSKMMRDQISAVPNPYYRDQTFIRTFLDRKGSTDEEVTFDAVLDRIRKFAAQTDSAAAVMYLLGWQYTGHDTGYPSMDVVNENLGGYDKLVNLIHEARKYNVNVTFYDNYDDSYPNHPGWDPDVICRDPEGNLMRGGAWDGEQSYLISSYKYAVKSGLDRVRYTLSRYPIRTAYFIDVLAGGYNGGRKYDFNPKSPAGAIKNFEGKKLLVEEFNRHGIDVATEDFTGYFVGLVGSFGDIIAFDNIYFNGEEQIPMIPFIYHGKTSFGMKTSSRLFYPRTFLYGQRAQSFTNKDLVYTPAEYILDARPKQMLYGKTMKSYERYGDLERVIYEDGTRVETNVKTNQYLVALGNGLVIAKDYTSFVPVKEGEYLACSRDGGMIRYRIPETWADVNKISAFRIRDDGSLEKTEFILSDRELSFDTQASVPYKILYR